MNKTENSISLIDTWNEIKSDHLEKINDLVAYSIPLKNELNRYRTKKRIKQLNVFKLASSFYYRENFHSYILYGLLSKNENPEAAIFLSKFIDFINIGRSFQIDKSDFKNVIVHREKDNIDLRIRDESSKKSIIIENKINKAVDQFRQIPRYLKNEEDQKYEVVSIIYLNLIKGKTPSKSGWKDQEKEKIKKLIQIIPATGIGTKNLIDDWLKPLSYTSELLDSISILRQYINLLNELSGKKMNSIILSKFYQTILEEERYETALSIRNMIEDLGEFRAMKVKDDFIEQATIFNNVEVFPWGKKLRLWRTKFTNCNLKGLNLIFELVYSNKSTKVELYDNDNRNLEKVDKVKVLLDDLNIIDLFTLNSDKRYIKTFKFPTEEENLNEFISNLLSKFSSISNSKKYDM